MNSGKSKIGKILTNSVEPSWYEMEAHPIFWRGKAEQLKRSALILANEFFDDCAALRAYVAEHQEKGHSSIELNCSSTLDQFVLLAAFSIENLLKAYVIFKEPNLVVNGKLEGILTSHSLLALAERADIGLSDEERHFCELASSASVTWGRYPISKTNSNVIKKVTVKGKAVEIFEQLYERLNDQFGERFLVRNVLVGNAD